MKEKDILLSVIIVTKNPGDDIYITLSSLLPLNNYNVEIIIKDNSDKQDISNLNEEFKFKNYQFFYSDIFLLYWDF